MIACPRCNGRGLLYVEPRRNPAVRGAALGKLPPYGRDVAQAALDDKLPLLGVNVFFRAEPANEYHDAINAWTMAARARDAIGLGAAMVLPLNASVNDFRWPAIPVRFEGLPCVAFWAFGCDPVEEHAFGEAFIAAGYDLVAVLGGPSGPLQFAAV